MMENNGSYQLLGNAFGLVGFNTCYFNSGHWILFQFPKK